MSVHCSLLLSDITIVNWRYLILSHCLILNLHWNDRFSLYLGTFHPSMVHKVICLINYFPPKYRPSIKMAWHKHNSRMDDRLRRGIPSQRQVTWTFYAFFDIRLRKLLKKHMSHRWFDIPDEHCKMSHSVLKFGYRMTEWENAMNNGTK